MHNLVSPMRTLCCSAVLLVLAGSSCSTCPSTNSACNAGVGGGGGNGGSGGGGGGADVYDRYVLDTARSDRVYMALVTDPGSDRVGVAYFTGEGYQPYIQLPGDAGIATDGGAAPTYEVKYVEWENGTVKAPQVVDTVQRNVGIAVDFHPTTGEPAVAYLGGGSDNVFYWTQTDAELATRANGTTWTNNIIGARNGMDTMCGNRVSDVDGPVVGLYPAIKYDSTGRLTWCYRDVHNGQFPQQDWAGSDIECLRGTPPNMAGTGECTKAGGNDKDAPGGHMQLLMINDTPYVFWDKVLGGADTSGQDVNFTYRTGANMWSAQKQVLSVAGTQQGASVAYDPTEGLGMAVLDISDNVLRYVSKPLAAANFNTADPVFAAGTGGWYPSLAMDPMFHEPAIAFYVCSDRSFQNASECRTDFDGVRVAQRNSVSNQWNTETVDTSTVIAIRLGFLPNGRKVIAYRERGGPLKLAVRKVP